ncbi:unnamed protein product [Symbiodinium sp. CCMP2456]|nr:unnamed protein product [Symbiodinium sp. CCMP2456]
MESGQVHDERLASLQDRVQQLEEGLQRTHDEVEACSVLVLSFDRGGVSTPRGRSDGPTEETGRLKARLEVLEEAWALRSTTLAQHSQDSLARVEDEVQQLWRELSKGEPQKQQRESKAEADCLSERVEKLQLEVADLQILKVEDVDSLVRKFTEEVDKSVQLQASRCSRLEEDLAVVKAAESTTEADRQRCVQLEKMVDALVQQRRQDLQQSQENLREIDARFHDLDQKEKQEKSWRKEAEAIRQEVQDLRSTHIPSLFQQHMKAMKAMQEGLTAVRSEVKKLGEILEAVQATQNGPGREEQSEKAREVLALKVQVSDLQEQVTEVVVRGLEERFVTLRADVSREVASVLRENKEDRSAAWRRLSALEAWPASQAELSAEFHRVRQEHAEDRILMEVLRRDVEGLGRQVVQLRRDFSIAQDPTAEATVVETGAASRAGLLEGLFGTSEPPAVLITEEVTSAPKAVRSAVKLTTSMASSRSPRSSRKTRSPEQRRSLDGQVRPRSNTPGERNDRGSTRSTVSGFPAVVGNKLEWALTAKSLQAAREAPGVAGALLVTGEMEVAGVYCRLKFFPDGSPLRQAPGFCSLYLVCTMPNVNVRFRLFAGAKSSPVLEANTARGGRDQGRHDLCQLKDVLGEDGGIVVGAEILEDDMPPLEYVGASSPLEVPLREGDRVALKGLSKKELNGQKGTLQSFDQAKQGRLAVKLDSGQCVSIKPENLSKMESSSNGSHADVRQEAADSDMPPLEYVGGTAVNGVSSKCHSPDNNTTQSGRQEADDEDDMPPLEYVGNTPAASSRSPALKSDEEDDMPPLEYVGASAPVEVPLREGDRVTLQGLSKKELNGQKGTLQSFEQSKQGRLAVKLDSGQCVSIKPENLSKMESSSNGSFVDVRQEAADSDMPPLEYVGGTAVNGVSSKCHSPDNNTMQNGLQEADDEDDMPPLEYVGNTPAASSRSPALKPDEEDDMPPLEYVGASAPLKVPLREGDRVTLQGLSKKELNGQKGTLQSFEQSRQGRLAVKLDSGQCVSIKPENLSKMESSSNGSFVDVRQEAADSDMPPLEYVGGTAVNGVSSKCHSPDNNTTQSGRQEADDEDDMPPLEYVGNTPAASSRSPALKSDEEDDMPPLEYVGASAPVEVPLREGERVTLQGLSKKELNGQKGTLQSFEQSRQGRLAVKLDSGERVSIKPENLCKLDPESNGSFVDVRQEVADSDMPPLEYVGGTAVNGVSSKCHSPDNNTTQSGRQEADDEDDMPPLEYVGNTPAASSRSPALKPDEEDDMPPLEYVGASAPVEVPLREGDRVTLQGLSKKELNGQKGTLQSFEQSRQGRLAVKLDSGERVSIKPENLRKLDPESNGSSVDVRQEAADSDMPPLEYVGSAPPARGSAIPVGQREQEQEDVDDMPPLEYVGQDLSAGLSLLEGDRVRLKGLSKAGLDGQTGQLQSFDRATKGRLPVKLDSGQLLAVKPDNLEKLASENREGRVETCNSASRKDAGESMLSKGRKTVASIGKSADGSTSPDMVVQDEELPPLEPAEGSSTCCLEAFRHLLKLVKSAEARRRRETRLHQGSMQTTGVESPNGKQLGSSRQVRSAGAMPPLQTLGQVDVQQRRHEVQEPPGSLPEENNGHRRELDQKEELQVLRREVQDLRSSHIPSLFQQCMKAMQDELTAVRGEMKRLGETLEAVQATRAVVRENSEKTEVLALKAQVSELQEQVRIMKETLDTKGIKNLP